MGENYVPFNRDVIINGKKAILEDDYRWLKSNIKSTSLLANVLIKNKANEVSFTLMTHHGDVAVNADNGMVRIKGRNICIDATNQLTLQANKIQLGHVQPGKTQDFQVTSTRVDLGRPKRGNMCKILKTCGPDLSFMKSLTPFSGFGGALGGALGASLGGAVGGPVGASIGSQVGEQVGS